MGKIKKNGGKAMEVEMGGGRENCGGKGELYRQQGPSGQVNTLVPKIPEGVNGEVGGKKNKDLGFRASWKGHPPGELGKWGKRPVG